MLGRSVVASDLHPRSCKDPVFDNFFTVRTRRREAARSSWLLLSKRGSARGATRVEASSSCHHGKAKSVSTAAGAVRPIGKALALEAAWTRRNFNSRPGRPPTTRQSEQGYLDATYGRSKMLAEIISEHGSSEGRGSLH